MNLSKRSRLSLVQLLDVLSDEVRSVFLEKHGFDRIDIDAQSTRDLIVHVSGTQLQGMLDEIARTNSTLSKPVVPRYMFNERWKDLVMCVKLDGYELAPEYVLDHFGPIEPQIDGQEPVEDDLTKALGSSGLPQAVEVQRLLVASADAFRRGDHNGCLSNVRVALETLARDIADQRRAQHVGRYDPARWGQVLAFLRTSQFIADHEEKGTAGVYSFVSQGAHAPVGLTEDEFVRFGRNLAVSMCYFLVKRYLGN